MANFSYKGRDKSGKLVNGELEANNQAAVADLLMQRNVIPIAITEIKGTAGSANIDLEALNQLFEKKVQLDDLVIFSRQMYSLSKSGIAILRAINGLAETTTSPALKRVLTDVGSQLEKGRPLSSCMNQHPKIFNKLMVSIIHVGENTGKLDDAFLQIAEYFEQEMETQKRIKAAMRYPTFVLIAVGMALIAVNVFVIPTFKDMFAKFKTELPPMTKVLLATSDFFVNYWYLLIGIVVAVIWGIKTYFNTQAGDLWWSKNKLKIPHVGSILERSILSRFCRSFSLMVSSGVPMTSGLNLVSEAVDNSYMGQRIVEMRKGIEKGESMTRVANNSGMFTPLVMQMISVGEETGRIDELLKDVSDYYDREVDYDLKNLTSKIEPILTGLVAGIVLVLALGIFTPMWNMMSAIK